MIFFILTVSILLCAGRGPAKVLADSNKYWKGLEERMVDTRDSGNLNHIELQGWGVLIRQNLIYELYFDMYHIYFKSLWRVAQCQL